MRRRRVTIEQLNNISEVPFESWKKRGIHLKAVSANGDGRVNSGILKDGRYFFRNWSKDFKRSWLEFGA